VCEVDAENFLWSEVRRGVMRVDAISVAVLLAVVASMVAAAYATALRLTHATRARARTRSRRAAPHVVSRDDLASQPGLRAYFDGFSDADRHARGGSACLQAYLSTVIDHPSGALVSTLAADAAEADRLCELHAPRLLRAGPWRVAVLRACALAENGWPHTHGEVVCLPESHFERPRVERVETMVHERVHVFQRRFPEEAAELVVRAWGMRPHPWDTVPPGLRALKRSNPDLDGAVYADRDGVASMQVFNSPRPTNLSDSRAVSFGIAGVARVAGVAGVARVAGVGVAAAEHPLERMAYSVARVTVRGPSAADAETAAWMARRT
jgi:hypothetical protein